MWLKTPAILPHPSLGSASMRKGQGDHVDELRVVFKCPRFDSLSAQFPCLFTQRVVAEIILRALLLSSKCSSVTQFIALTYEWLLR